MKVISYDYAKVLTENSTELWKKAHDKAMQVMDLEDLYRRFSTAISLILNSDANIRAELIKKNIMLSKWDYALRDFAEVAYDVLEYIERRMKELNYDKYEGPRINLDKIENLRLAMKPIVDPDCITEDNKEMEASINRSLEEIKQGKYYEDWPD